MKKQILTRLALAAGLTLSGGAMACSGLYEASGLARFDASELGLKKKYGDENHPECVPFPYIEIKEKWLEHKKHKFQPGKTSIAKGLGAAAWCGGERYDY